MGLGSLMNNELERIWKEAAENSGIFLQYNQNRYYLSQLF
jgi:hypothetical protein